ARARSGIDMVLAHLDVLEHAQGIVRQDGQRAVKRNEVGGDRLVVDAHEAYRQALRQLAGQTGLEESDDALLGLARADQENVGLAALHLELVGGNERNAAPGEEGRAEERDGRRRDAAPGALAAEGGNRLRMSEEEGGL